MKKACRTRWLSLHAGVDAAWEEFGGLVETLKILGETDKNSAKAVGILGRINNIDFLGSLCLFKNILPILSNLSKTFQSNALNFSRISPSINKSKEKIKLVTSDGRIIKQLKEALGNRLKGLGMTLTECHEDQLKSKMMKYANAICKNIDARFPQETRDVLKSFAIFDIELFPSSSNDPLFSVYGVDEIKILSKQFFPTNPIDDIVEQWTDFRYELVEIKSKYVSLIKNLTANKIKFKKTASEWLIEYILKCRQYEDDYKYIISFASITAVTPVTNAWPERGASAVKRIKSRFRSTMKNDLLNSCINVSLNGPPVNTKESDELIERVVERYIKECHYKVPESGKSYISKLSNIASTQTSETITIGESNIAKITLDDDSIDIDINDSTEYLTTHFEEDDDDILDDDSESEGDHEKE